MCTLLIPSLRVKGSGVENGEWHCNSVTLQSLSYQEEKEQQKNIKGEWIPGRRDTYGGGRSRIDMALCLEKEMLEQKRWRLWSKVCTARDKTVGEIERARLT